jgi:hypothetical protein
MLQRVFIPAATPVFQHAPAVASVGLDTRTVQVMEMQFSPLILPASVHCCKYGFVKNAMLAIAQVAAAAPTQLARRSSA